MPSPAPVVYKFGGTSLADAARIGHAADLCRAAPGVPVVVVSAMAGVTDRLVEAAAAAGRGDAAALADIADALERRHLEAAGVLAPPGEVEALAREVREGVQRLRDAARDPRREHAAELGDHLASLGEDLSARLVAAALRARGSDAAFVDARGLVTTDDAFGGARPNPDAVRRRAADRLLPLVARGTTPVVQGFVGATADGRTTTLGRGGSDYSAALLGAALDAPEVHIWTDVDGILSGDPRAVDHPRILRCIGYEEAVELAYFGAKVIHPAAAKHAVALGVRLRVRNTFAPEREGTLVLNDRRGAAAIAAVAYKPGVSLIKVRSHPAALPYGFLARVFEVLARHRLPVDLVATSHSSTAFTIDAAQDLTAVAADLAPFAEVEVLQDLATVTVVGTGLMEEPGTDARVFWEVARTPVHLISQASNVSLSFVVARDDAPPLVRRLHTALIELPDEAGRAFIE